MLRKSESVGSGGVGVQGQDIKHPVTPGSQRSQTRMLKEHVVARSIGETC
ncbi:rCG56372 [Rattus norvegicus]|uniref:RCG56372 n=1 Tax=Rattus norvegicus TaxID=10116 RepID=A6IAR1_RAT|nr:rCG56372 [Rattus norvegicus]